MLPLSFFIIQVNKLVMQLAETKNESVMTELTISLSSINLVIVSEHIFWGNTEQPKGICTVRVQFTNYVIGIFDAFQCS